MKCWHAASLPLKWAKTPTLRGGGGFSDAAVLIELCDLVRQRMDSCCASLIVPRLPLEHSTLRTAGA